MTAKQFFKSNVFKCLITLLCVLLVSGIFLTIMDGLLEVTPEEKRNRAISKIYDMQVDVEELTTANYNDSAEIQEAYKVITDGNYLIKSKGLGAYKGGSVTCWVVVKIDKDKNAVSGIGKVVIDSNENQTLMSQFTNSVLDQFSQKYNPDEVFTNQVITGATAVLTENAICNSVNAAVDYVKAQLGDVWVNPYEDFEFTKYVNVNKRTSHEVKADGSVEYHIVTKGYGEASSFKIDITVKDGIITYYKITDNGSTEHYDEHMPPMILNGELFIGKGLDYFTGIYGAEMPYKAISAYDDNNVTTGATTDSIASNSSYLCMYAGAFATANWQKCIDAANAEPPAEDGNGGETAPEGGKN